MKKLYVAARFEDIERAREVAAALRTADFEVPSRWIDEDETRTFDKLGDFERACFAQRDLAELRACDALVHVSTIDSSRTTGGNHVEFGVALERGLPIFALRPWGRDRANVFHYLPTVSSHASLAELVYAVEHYFAARAQQFGEQGEHDKEPGSAGPAPSPEESELAEADRLVSGDRRGSYGHPYYNFLQTADIATPMLQDVLAPGRRLEPEHVALFMVAVKLARECHKPKRDNRVDAAGYLKCLQLVREERARLAAAPLDGSSGAHDLCMKTESTVTIRPNPEA